MKASDGLAPAPAVTVRRIQMALCWPGGMSPKARPVPAVLGVSVLTLEEARLAVDVEVRRAHSQWQQATELAEAFGTNEIMFIFKYGSMPIDKAAKSMQLFARHF